MIMDQVGEKEGKEKEYQLASHLGFRNTRGNLKPSSGETEDDQRLRLLLTFKEVTKNT